MTHRNENEVSAEDELLTVPWHFKLLLALTTIYLAWRLIQGIVWVAQRFA